MRIAVVTPLFPTKAGPDRASWLYSTVMALKRYARLDVYCAASVYPPFDYFQPRSFSYEPLSADYRVADLRIHVAPFSVFPVLSRPFNGLLCARALLKALRESKPELILAYHAYPTGWAAIRAARRLGIPAVVCAIGSDLRRIPDRLTRRFVGDALSSAGAVITKSDDLRCQALQFGLAGHNVTTIRNGCDKSIFRTRAKPDVRTELGIPEQDEIVLFVGRLTTAKGFHDLLEAVNLLLATHPSLHVVCIGRANNHAFMAGASPHLRARLRFLGAMPPVQVAKWLAASDLFCLPSHSEGCPNVLLEAQSCGCPAVATAVGGIPEIMNETCGILVPPRNPPLLAQAISAALARTWDSAAISRRMTRSWEDVGADIYAVCSRLVCLDRKTGRVPGVEPA